MLKTCTLKIVFQTCALLGLAIGSATSFADEVYRWTDKDGTVHYSDHAPAPDAKPTDLPSLQTFSNAAISNGRPLPGNDSGKPAGDVPADSASTAQAGANYRPIVTSPGDQETLRETSGQISIGVVPAPPTGILLVYNMDGKALNNTNPTASTHYTVPEVDRGEHTVWVTAVTRAGRVVTQSPSVTFFLMPPRVTKH